MLTENISIDDDPDDKNFQKFHQKLSEIKILKIILNHFPLLQVFDEGPESLTLKHKGWKKFRPALRNTDAKKKKKKKGKKIRPHH